MMGVVHYLQDKLVNLVANLGTQRDKATGNQFAMPFTNDMELINAYRGSWMARKIVDIPAFDCTRRWRNWQADKEQIQAIEAEEKRLNVKSKVREAIIKARLFGGAAIYIGTADRDPSLPLDPETIKSGGILYLNVMQRRQLKIIRIETDPQSEYFDRPASYQVNSDPKQPLLIIHPSRLVIFQGAPQPDTQLSGQVESYWGDSVLLAVKDTILQAEATTANVSSLVFEAKVDVIGIPNFAESMDEGGEEYANAVLKRMQLAAMGKGINGMLALDAAETYTQKTASFATLPDLMDRFDQKVSGGCDIPATRFLGQSPAGLSATGESDLANYYDKCNSTQELDMGPAMTVLDECLIRSATGARDDKIHYVWAPLWQSTPTERAIIGMNIATTIKTLHDSLLFNDEALSAAAVTTLVESNVLPGLEAAIEEYGNEIDDPVEDYPETPAIGDPAAATNTKEQP